MRKSAVLAKLANTAGETLVETLAAVVVAALGMLMLVMAISVGTNMIKQSDAAARDYYAASDALAAVSVNGNAALGDDGNDAGVAITAKGFGVIQSSTSVNDLEYVSVKMPGASSYVIAYKQHDDSEEG